jgi:hypothetical protein
LGGHAHSHLKDNDADTKILLEESADDDTIRFDTAGTERMTINATGVVATVGDLTVGGNITDGATATTQSASDNSTKLATTAYVDTGLGALSSDSVTDADGDTKIQVEESADEDIIRFDTAGTERLTIGATGIIATTGTNITLANVGSPTDLTASGAGFTVKGAADYTLKWHDHDEVDSIWNFWEFNQHLRITSTAKADHTDYTGGGIEIGTISTPAVNSDSGIAQAGSATTITLAAGFETADDYYNGHRITIYYGTGDGQERTITDYVGSTGVATVAAWTTQPDATSYYVITSSWYDYSGIKNKSHKDGVNEYMIKSTTNGSYTYISSGNSGAVGINSYANNLTAYFDYGGGTLGYSGSKTYGRFTTHATGTTKTASYTVALVDESSYIWMNIAGANTLTVPPNSSVAFDNGTMITIIQYGAGQTTITAGSGVTLIATPGLKLRDQNSVCTIVKYTTDVWLVYGDLDD